MRSHLRELDPLFMSVNSLGILATFGSEIVIKRLFVKLGFRIAVMCVCSVVSDSLQPYGL